MTNPTPHMSTEAGGPAMPDQGKFHYYDQPPRFTVNLLVSGTASLTIAAETHEEAKAKAWEIIKRDDFEVDLEDWDDVDISYISEHPTRMYLITRPESHSTTGTSKILPGDLPREPDQRDRDTYARLGYKVSWEAAE